MVGKIFRVVFSKTARRRLKEEIDYVVQESKSKEVGRKVRKGILAEARKLEKLPGSKPHLSGTEDYDYDVHYTKAWSYKIIFRILNPKNIVRILTIRHDKQLDENVRKDLE